MRWEAANVRQDGADEHRERNGEGNSASVRRQSTETSEAALARLTKAYSAGISCLGALNRSSSILFKVSEREQDETLSENPSGRRGDASKQLERVANAARSSFEVGVLLDPLILPHTPTIYKVMHRLSMESKIPGDRSESFLSSRPVPPTITSAAHHATVRELAYLTLVNYADLLISGCACSYQSKQRNAKYTILDRGVVEKHGFLLEGVSTCCWKNETEESTYHLALAAFCDASVLHGSDPTLWLKLACTARGLDHILARQDSNTEGTVTDCPESTGRYRRLEKHALESGRIALGVGLPPNRTVVRALEEINAVQRSAISTSKLLSPAKCSILDLDLPRYSWYVLGRMLIKACRQGTFATSNAAPREIGQLDLIKGTGAPTIALRISPMLGLPPAVLGVICQFLAEESVWKFESTCRALSVSIISARASMDHEFQNGSTRTATTAVNPISDNNDTDQKAKRRIDMEDTTPNDEEKERRTSIHRSSKRVRSQLITSGKLAERTARRNSVEFCLLACILSCTTENSAYKAMLNENEIWKGFDQSFSSLFRRNSHVTQYHISGSESKQEHRRRDEARERASCASITSFVERWSCKNSGPQDLLAKYVTHVSLNVADVFAIDPGGTMVLASCLSESVDLLGKRCGTNPALMPSWFGDELHAVGIEQFAVNLLNAELRLKRCERHSIGQEFDNDANAISAAVSVLLRESESLKSNKTGVQSQKRLLTELHTRCHWLAAGFFLWRSRVSQNVSESRTAETLGLEHIDRAIEYLRTPAPRPILTVRTPHLESPLRTDIHWKVLSIPVLSAFQDEIRAASVVSLARQQFLEVVEDASTRSNEGFDACFSENDLKKLSEIGEQLFDRYDTEYDGQGGKYEELANDFRLLCSHDLLRSDRDEEMTKGFTQGKLRWGRLWDVVPTEKLELGRFRDMLNPSILTILVACLQSKTERSLSIARLMARLVRMVFDQQGILSYQGLNNWDMRTFGRIGRSPGHDTLSDSDSSDESDEIIDDEMSIEKGRSIRRQGRGKGRVLCLMCQFLIEKISDIFSQLSTEDKTAFLAADDFVIMMKVSMLFSAEWYRQSMHDSFIHQSPLDFQVLLTVRSFVSSVIVDDELVDHNHQMQSLFFVGLARVLVSQRQVFPLLLRSHGDNRSGRAVRQKLCAGRAEYIGAVASEMSMMLSRNLVRIVGDEMLPSFLIEALALSFSVSIDANSTKEPKNPVALAALCDSALWFWKYGSNPDPANVSRTATVPGSISSFDRPIVEKMICPIASLIVSLCGSALGSNFPESGKKEEIGERGGVESDSCMCISEFFDSDASANDWADSSDSDDSEHRPRKSNGSLLRSLCLAVQCVALVFDSLDEKTICTPSTFSWHNSEHGPMFPLVVVRVLNRICETFLSEWGSSCDDAGGKGSAWAEEYPFGARTAGNRLDQTLCKAYRCLHGFSLSCGNQSTLTKEHCSVVNSYDEASHHRCPPESVGAAAQLYRCIVRAYAKGRKSPPTAALNCVISALPDPVEDQKSASIKRFLFTARATYFEPSDVGKLFKKGINCDSVERLPDCVTEDNSTGSTQEDSTEEVIVIRKGVCRELAKGALPQLSTSLNEQPVAARESHSKQLQEREIAAAHERELSKKFQAIIDDLCYGDALCCESWYRAGQCLISKAELVADRLVLPKSFRTGEFSIPDHGFKTNKSLKFAELELELEREFRRRHEGWVPHVGENLFPYVHHPWSTFVSLLSCATEVDEDELCQTQSGFDMDAFDAHVRGEMRTMYSRGDYVRWQQSWGGMFVSALRKIATRCLFAALYLALKQRKSDFEENAMVAEVSESLGTLYYSMLIGSQEYGYPMHRMTDYWKRQLAETSALCFKSAVDSVSVSGDEDESESRQTFDLLFMIGKCHEKVAGIFKRELFLSDEGENDSDHTSQIRQYEREMDTAIKYYYMGWKEAKAIEDNGGRADIQAGGSEHGALELFYRLHASRFKCILFAVSQGSSVRDAAENEALRLSTKHFYMSSEGAEDSERTSLRERVWSVLVDVVAALAQCRLEQPFFHRSVYRHAQALMWAQVFHDPVAGAAEKGLGMVPATKSYLIRGLNSATPCAHSSEAVLGVLFEKKRPQLCGVWVTAPGSHSSAFPFLNNSVRKYDSLRRKYLTAWIDCLRVCHRTNKLETLLQWTASCKRDLPALFRASAISKGGPPSTSHHRDNLLPKNSALASLGLLQAVKRHANSAIAGLIVDDVSIISSSKDKKVESQKSELLKNAYKCFLRLNCPVEDVERSREWRFGRDSVPEVEALCSAFLVARETNQISSQDEDNWSGKGKKLAVLKAAVAECQSSFKSLHSKTSRKRKQPASALSDKPNEPSSPPRSSTGKKTSTERKRKADGEGNTESFVVTVPPGLNEGDTFHSSISLAGVRKHVKLTVPAGNPSKLRFSLTVAEPQSSLPPQKKQARSPDDESNAASSSLYRKRP